MASLKTITLPSPFSKFSIFFALLILFAHAALGCNDAPTSVDSGQTHLDSRIPPKAAEWVLGASGNCDATADRITYDLEGNIYIIGEYFYGECSFGSLKTAKPKSHSAYIAKTNSKGKPIWTSSAFASEAIGFSGIKADSHTNVYIKGYYTGNVKIGGTVMPSQQGVWKPFIWKLIDP